MSRINKDEATLLVSTLQKYIEKIGKERVLDESIDFGLISPYKSQVAEETDPAFVVGAYEACLLYTSPSPRDCS